MTSTAFQHFRSFENFKTCSDEFVQELSESAASKSIAQGELILKEGEQNDCLRILTTGEVEVQVNGERVAVMTCPGDLMGEMSALAGRTITASLRAKTDVTFYEIKSAHLDAKIRSTANFGIKLYAVLAQQLSDKIIKTNEKARQFEITNRSLDEINKTLDKKVQERTDATFKQLNELQLSLAPLAPLLKEAAEAADSAHSASLEEASQRVVSAVEMLKPISALYSSERLMRSRRVLMADPDRKQQTIAKMALGGTGVKLETVSSEDECTRSVATNPDLVIVSAALASMIPAVAKICGKSKIVYVMNGELAGEVEALQKLAPSLSNFISRNPNDRTSTVKNIATTVTKLLSNDLFGLEKYLMLGVQTHAHTVKKSGERSGLIAEMEEQMQSLGVRSTITDRAASVAEELLMNAIYDAPTADGTSPYAHLPRTEAVELKPSEYSEFRYAVDGMMAAVSVSDPFGGFKMETLLNYLERNARSDGSNVQEAGKGGAGRGLALISSAADLLVINVQAGVKTEVIALFNLDPTLKDSSPRSLHFFGA